MTADDRKLLWIWTILTLSLLAAPLFGRDSSTRRPDLRGTWSLDEDLTARMRESSRPSREGRMEPPSSGGRRGGGRPGGGGMGGPGGGMRRMGSPPSFEGLDELTIEQTEESVTVTDGSGRKRTLQTHGKKVREEGLPGGPADVRASWDKDGTLVVRIQPDEGPARTETYVVSNDGKRLFLTFTLEGGGRMGEMKIRRAYQRLAEKAADPEPAPSPALGG